VYNAPFKYEEQNDVSDEPWEDEEISDAEDSEESTIESLNPDERNRQTVEKRRRLEDRLYRRRLCQELGEDFELDWEAV